MTRSFLGLLTGVFFMSSAMAGQEVTLTDTQGRQLGTTSAPLPIDTVVKGATTDRGGTITAGGTAQPAMAANTARRGYSVQNQSTGDLYINGITTATGDYHSLKIPAGTLYESPSNHVGTGAVSIFGATTGQAYYAREF